MPGFIKPQLATVKSRAPKGDQWLHEIKYDGYRVQLHTYAGRKKAFTRNGHDWVKRFSSIADSLDISDRPSSMVRWLWSTKAEPTFPNFRPNSPRADKTGSSITPSTSFGGTGIFASSLRLNASRCSWTF
jgi:hypothetical protein